MSECHRMERRIREAGGVLDRETIAHCLTCDRCRRELAACLAADDPDAPPVPGRLDPTVLAAAQARRGQRFRRLVRPVFWSGAAAAAAALLICLLPARPGRVADTAAATGLWDGSELIGELDAIDAETTRVQMLLADGGEEEQTI